jgi:hypothetical protein
MNIRATRRQLADLMSTALEQGIGYWAEVKDCHEELFPPAYEGDTQLGWTTRCKVRAQPDGEPTEATKEWKSLTFATLKQGIARLLESPTMKNEYHIAACVALMRGDEDGECGDCETADAIVQYGLYGELVYG